MYLVADPGLVTGWILFTPVNRLEIDVHEYGATRGEQEFLNLAWEFNRQRSVSECICEGYVPYQDKVARTWQPEAIYIIGALRFIFGIKHVDLRQMSSDAKRWATKEKLDPYRAQHIGQGTEGDHVQSALSHGLLWTATKWQGWAP